MPARKKYLNDDTKNIMISVTKDEYAIIDSAIEKGEVSSISEFFHKILNDMLKKDR